MRLYMIETEENGLTRMNWFQTMEVAAGFWQTGMGKIFEVENPGCETLVGGSRMVQASECGAPAVNLVDEAPICQYHLERMMFDG